jgi:hypothetical protein
MAMRLNASAKFVWMHPKWTSWVMALLLVFSSLFVISEVLDLKHQINLANHDAEVNRIRAALIESWVHQQVQSSNAMGSDLEGVNPMRLMLKVPLHYLGEYQSPPEDFRDAWFFDTQQKCLVYIFENGDLAAYRFVKKSEMTNLKGSVIGDWRLARDFSYTRVSIVK